MITGLVGVWILPENETMRTRSIRVSSINPKYRSQNGALYNKKMTTLICYPMSKKGSTLLYRIQFARRHHYPSEVIII